MAAREAKNVNQFRITCDECGHETEVTNNQCGGDSFGHLCKCGSLTFWEIHEGVKGYRMQEKTRQLRRGIFEIFTDVNRRMTVRQVYYQAVSRKLVDKDEKYYRRVQRQILLMRREGVLPYSLVADTSRLYLKQTSFSGAQDAIDHWLNFYKQDVWRDKNVYVEIWLEKRSLAGIFQEVTLEYDVPLYVSGGFSSDSFIYEAIEQIRDIGKPAYVYFFSDYDPSGIWLSKAVEEGLNRMADDDVEIHFTRLGLNQEQIDFYNLPTRPTKKSKHSKGFIGESAELDTLHPNVLIEKVRSCVLNHITDEEMRKIKMEEAVHRDTLKKMSFM